MSRFETISNADIVFEAVAPQINIFWNPENGKGSVQFWVEQQEFRRTANSEMEFVGRSHDDRWEFRPMAVPLAQILQDTYDVTLPDGSVVQTSGGFLMLAIKSAFDKYYNAKLADVVVPDTDNVPEPPPLEPPTGE